jgi:hypothetical protein
MNPKPCKSNFLEPLFVDKYCLTVAILVHLIFFNVLKGIHDIHLGHPEVNRNSDNKNVS